MGVTLNGWMLVVNIFQKKKIQPQIWTVHLCTEASLFFTVQKKIVLSQAALKELSPQGHEYWLSILVFDNHAIYLVAALYCGLLMPLLVVKLVSLSLLWWISPSMIVEHTGGAKQWNYSHLLLFVEDSRLNLMFYWGLRLLEIFVT